MNFQIDPRLVLYSEIIALSNLINQMRQKFDLNAAFTLYTNFKQNINFGMVWLYTVEFLPYLILTMHFVTMLNAKGLAR